MPEQTPIDPGHNKLRDVFRVTGPIALILGGLLLVIGFIDFCATMGSMRPPKLFIWGSFPAFILLGAGVYYDSYRLCRPNHALLFSGIGATGSGHFQLRCPWKRRMALVRWQVPSEQESSKPSATVWLSNVRCAKCGHENDPDAKFCSACGADIAEPVSCPGCGNTNSPDAKFCDQCGQALT